jgi:integrase
MAQFTFVLKDPKAAEPSLVYFIVRNGNKRMKYSTGEKVLPSHWDKKSYTIKQGVKGANGINTQLERYQAVFRKYLSYLDGAEKPFSFVELKERLNEKFKADHEAQQNETSLIRFAESYIQATDKKVMTKRKYVTALNKLKEYETHTRKRLTFDSIDLDFYYSFLDFLKGQNLALNTIGSHIKNVKVFMDVALENGLHTNTAYKNKRFKVLEEETTHVYLTEDELQAMYNLDLTNKTRLEAVRDYFLIGCRTGLRFSDLRSLTRENIVSGESGNFFKIRTVKTGETVFIPLHAQTVAILEKYEYTLPRLISNQKFNEYIKEVSELAGITSTVVTHRTEGGRNIERTQPKYELVTVHTARRTFATLAYKAGLPANSIMKITGHRTERAFQKYIKLSSKEHAELLAKSEFFSPLRKVN